MKIQLVKNQLLVLTRLFLLASCLLLTLVVAAQIGPKRTYMLGPVVGTTQVGYGSFGGGKGLNVGNTPRGISFGVVGSYQVNRCLVDVKLLYQKRTYLVKPFSYDPGSPSSQTLQIETDFEVLSLPLSVSYRLTPDTNFQWFIGGNIAAEYLLRKGVQTVYTRNGDRNMSTDPYIGIPINLGLGIQTTFRYRVLPRSTLQLEPVLRYYPTDGFPTASTGTFQFQTTAAILVQL